MENEIFQILIALLHHHFAIKIIIKEKKGINVFISVLWNILITCNALNNIYNLYICLQFVGCGSFDECITKKVTKGKIKKMKKKGK